MACWDGLIIETDLGHDPDDLFAILYLIASGFNIKAILITPGDPDQVAIARFLCKECGINAPIGTSKLNRTKLSSGSIHHELLNKYKYPLSETGDGLGEDILENIVDDQFDDLFIIGPVTSIGKYLIKKPWAKFNRATMQGGFLPYNLYRPKNPNPDFEGKTWMPTFNLNGDRAGAEAFLNANITARYIVGKNICHSVIFDRKKFIDYNTGNVHLISMNAEKQRALSLFREAAKMYLSRHDSKKFHDPTAAVCHTNLNIATWFMGKTVKQEGGWTTREDPNGDYILADINHNLLWKNLMFKNSL